MMALGNVGRAPMSSIRAKRSSSVSMRDPRLQARERRAEAAVDACDPSERWATGRPRSGDAGAYCRFAPKAPTMSDCSKMPAASAWSGP